MYSSLLICLVNITYGLRCILILAYTPQFQTVATSDSPPCIDQGGICIVNGTCDDVIQGAGSDICWHKDAQCCIPINHQLPYHIDETVAAKRGDEGQIKEGKRYSVDTFDKREFENSFNTLDGNQFAKREFEDMSDIPIRRRSVSTI